HTHVQTNDPKILPNGTAYITDVEMTGPQNSAIDANFKEVYKKMRFNGKEKFKVSDNDLQYNAVLIPLNKKKKNNKKRHKIKLIIISDIKK
ncbi:YmdB family metallophosphoesterase, partial [Mycoplasmopsis synoviae]